MSDISELGTTMALQAKELLAGLTEAQRLKANLQFDEDNRRLWYFTPNERAGLPLAEMTSRAQQQCAQQLLAMGLSEAGYNAASTIMGLENVLVRRNGFLGHP